MDDVKKWDLSPTEAIALQRRLSSLISLEDVFGPISTVAGVDMSIGRGWDYGVCGIVVLSFPYLDVIEEATHTDSVTFPYVPGLLAFREVPLVIATYAKLSYEPDLLFLDGQGYAHPRRFGLACHAGLALNKPAIGCGKSKLIGQYTEPGIEAGSVSPLYDRDERIGDVVRTKTGTKPVFISPGHRVSFDTATRLTLQCDKGYRIPEPTRLAHILVSGP